MVFNDINDKCWGIVSQVKKSALFRKNITK